MSPKQVRRKPPRRPRAKTVTLDDDLLTLAALLDEHRLERNAEGWFTLPWNDGLNAAHLALDVGGGPHTALGVRVACLINEKRRDAEAYWLAEDLMRLVHETTSLVTPINRGFRAALRCYQLWVSNSHGGGHGYNLALESIRDVGEALVIKWRCHDALGVFPGLEGDVHDPARRAFVIAWRRGLFHAAYALRRQKL